MFTDYNAIESRLIARHQNYQASVNHRVQNLEKQLFSKVIHNPQANIKAQQVSAQRAANNQVRPGSQANELMKSIQAQFFEVHKRYKENARKKAAENESIYKLLESIKKVFAAS